LLSRLNVLLLLYLLFSLGRVALLTLPLLFSYPYSYPFHFLSLSSTTIHCSPFQLLCLPSLIYSFPCLHLPTATLHQPVTTLPLPPAHSPPDD
jgi:hypothetical protein